MTGINKRGVTGCPSKLKLCGMIQYLHLEYPGRRREDDPQMYLGTLSHAEYSAFWKTCTGYAPENRMKPDKHSATLLKAAFAGRAASTVFPTLEWLSFASIGDVEGRATAGSSVRLDMLAPKHICIVSSPFFMPRRQDYSATWPDNISKYLQVNTKHQKVAHTDAPTTTETLTVHFDDNVEFRGALRLSLPHGLTRYLLPLPTLQIGLSATNRAKTIGEWFFELMNPKVWPSEQYAFAFYIQCPPTTTEKGKAYRNRMKEVLAEWMDKAKDREAARQKRAGLADEEWEELVIEWDLVDNCPDVRGVVAKVSMLAGVIRQSYHLVWRCQRRHRISAMGGIGRGPAGAADLVVTRALYHAFGRECAYALL